MTSTVPAIVILGQGSLATARRIQQRYPEALIHGLAGRVEGSDRPYTEFGATRRELYQQDSPIIALCAAGIVIRTLAPLLLEKGAEPAGTVGGRDGVRPDLRAHDPGGRPGRARSPQRCLGVRRADLDAHPGSGDAPKGQR